MSVTIIIKEEAMNLKRNQEDKKGIERGRRNSGNDVNIVFTYKILKTILIKK